MPRAAPSRRSPKISKSPLSGSGAAVGRPSGLNLSPASEAAAQSGEASVLANISSPALIYFDAWDGDGYFRRDWNARLRRAALEEGTDGLIALARFLLANELAAEALGMLDLVVQAEPSLANDPHVRSLRGVASYMMHRLDDATEYFSHPSLANDPAANLWRAMIAVEEERWADAAGASLPAVQPSTTIRRSGSPASTSPMRGPHWS